MIVRGFKNALRRASRSSPRPTCTEDLKKPSTSQSCILHGDDDQIVPIADASLKAIKLLKHGSLKVYPRFPYGMCTTHADVINADLLAFIQD